MLNKFNDINHRPLRIFNRTMYLFNIKEDSGIIAAENYLELFNQIERKEIRDMAFLVKKIGLEQVKLYIRKGCTFDDDKAVA